MKKKKPSSLTERDYNIFQTMETLLQDTDETFSQSCMRYGELPDDELLTPMQTALWTFCEDNPKLRKEEFATWYEGLIEDEDLFRLDKPTPDVLKKVRIIFDEKTNDWMAKGLLDSNYETSYTFGRTRIFPWLTSTGPHDCISKGKTSHPYILQTL